MTFYWIMLRKYVIPCVPCEPKLKAPELRVERYVVIKSVHFVHYRLFTQDPVRSVLLYYPRRGMTWQIGVKAWRE